MPAYEINFTESALEDLEWLRKLDQAAVLAAVQRLLRHYDFGSFTISRKQREWWKSELLDGKIVSYFM